MWLRARSSRWSGASGREALRAVARNLGVALLASLAALGVAFLLDPWLHQGVFVLFLGAVTLSAWYGGLGSGLLATAGGALAFSYFLTDPVHGQVTPGRGSAGVAVFVLVSLLITLLYVRLREGSRRRSNDWLRNLATYLSLPSRQRSSDNHWRRSSCFVERREQTSEVLIHAFSSAAHT